MNSTKFALPLVAACAVAVGFGGGAFLIQNRTPPQQQGILGAGVFVPASATNFTHAGVGHPGVGHPGVGHPGVGHPGVGHPGGFSKP